MINWHFDNGTLQAASRRRAASTFPPYRRSNLRHRKLADGDKPICAGRVVAAGAALAGQSCCRWTIRRWCIRRINLYRCRGCFLYGRLGARRCGQRKTREQDACGFADGERSHACSLSQVVSLVRSFTGQSSSTDQAPSTGNVSVISAPPPSALVAETVPPQRRATSATIDNPRPEPGRLRAASDR
jgi:hypothetical protein